MTTGKTVHAEGSLIVTGHVASETLKNLYEQKKEEIRKRFPSFFIENMLKRLEAENQGAKAGGDAGARNTRKMDRIRKLTADTEIRKVYGVLDARPIADDGFFSSLWYLLEDIDAGCEVQLARIPVFQETIEICDLFDINPFEAPSAGNMILACRRGAELSWFLTSQGIDNALIGVLLPPPARRIGEGDHTRYLDRPR